MQDALFEAEEKLQQVQKDFERMKDEFQDFIYGISQSSFLLTVKIRKRRGIFQFQTTELESLMVS